ncbi:MAG TPA: hypothetical protein VFE78_01420 [Gemmataceae bacterium]|jgi:uncharacterized membrane protein|nr:hypothetical protein [Gemmataceae bacterium]
MPEIVSCPECERKLACPHEYVGRKVRCPGCSGMFKAAPDPEEDEVADVQPATRTAPGRDERFGTAPAGRGPARLRRDEEDEDDDHPRREAGGPPRSDKERQGWKMTRLGLMFVSIAGWTKIAYWLIMLLGISLLLLLVGAAMFSAVSSASSGDPRAAQSGAAGAAGAAVGGALGVIVLLIVLGLVGFLETILRLVGLGLCIMVPPKRGAATKGLAIAAFAVSAFYVLTVLGGHVFSGLGNFSSRGGGAAVLGMLGAGGGILGLFSWVITLAGYVLTLLTLRSVAVRVREESAAKQIVSLMIAWGVWGFACVAGVILSIVGIGFTALSAVNSGSATGAATSFGVFGFICIAAMGLISLLWAGLYVWYLMIIQKVRRAMTRYTAQSA